MLATVVFSRLNARLRFWHSLADAALLTSAFYLAYSTRRFLPLERYFSIPAERQVLLILFSVTCMVLAGLWLGVYDSLGRPHPGRMLGGVIRQGAWAVLALILFQFALRMDLSRPFLALFVAYSALLLVTFRTCFALLTAGWRRGFGPRTHILIAGTGEQALQVGRAVEAAGQGGLSLSGFLGEEEGTVRLEKEYPVHRFDGLSALLRREVVDDLILAVDSQRLAELEDLLLICDEEGVRTRLSLEFFPHVHSRAYLDRLGDRPLLTFSSAPSDEIRLAVKRATDIVLGAAALLAVSPLLALVALLIRLTSSGPALFRQERCGLNGRRFTLYKFRTMVADAEQRKASVAHLNVKQTAFKIPNDPRVTGLGRWLRKFSIDEWPQLWNVVRGEMSLVGPRPAVPEEVEEYKRWQRRRLRMRPGLTCLWTLAGRDAINFEEWMRLDLAYIDTWSLALDWRIILRTIPHVVTGRGAS